MPQKVQLADNTNTLISSSNPLPTSGGGGGGGGGAVTVADGADVTQGTTTQSKATDATTTSWSVIQLLKGIFDKLLGSVAVTGTFWQTTQPVSGTVTANAGTNLNTSALAVEAGNLASIKTNTTPYLGTPITDYGSNPAQTAAAGADTLFKWGVAGTTTTYHQIIQNNTGAVAYFAYDQDSTQSGNKIFTLQDKQMAVFDKACTVLHWSTPAQQSFGGQSGITVEAWV